MGIKLITNRHLTRLRNEEKLHLCEASTEADSVAQKKANGKSTSTPLTDSKTELE